MWVAGGRKRNFNRFNGFHREEFCRAPAARTPNASRGSEADAIFISQDIGKPELAKSITWKMRRSCLRRSRGEFTAHKSSQLGNRIEVVRADFLLLDFKAE